MNGTFNGKILVDKLVKLNSSQQSIETLSHWCIFHRKKAKQVVETWERQFHCSPQDQRVSFLYLANDILQNSRRKGSEFVSEFWTVLPGALNDVIENGDEFGRNAALRLVDIWEERKVFGSRGQILKEELLGRNTDNHNRNEKISSHKPKQSSGDVLEKLISSYEHVSDGPANEDTFLRKCQTAISCVEKVEKEIGNDFNLGDIKGSEVLGELQGQRGILGECIEQLKLAESSRVTLVSHLREALHEQELKLEQVRNLLQAAESRSEQAVNICQQLMNSNNVQLPTEQRQEEPTFSVMPAICIPEAQTGTGEKDQSAPVMYVQQGTGFSDNHPHTEEENRKTAAAAVAAKLAASTSSAQMLSFVLSSLASEGVIGQPTKEEYNSENKRPKLENGSIGYTSSQSQPPPPPFPHPDSLQKMVSQQPPLLQSSPMSHPGPNSQPPSLPPLQPPMPLLPPGQFLQTAGSMASVQYSYGSAPPLRPPQLPSFMMASMPPYSSPVNPYHNFQATEGGGSFFSQPPLPATPPPGHN